MALLINVGLFDFLAVQKVIFIPVLIPMVPCKPLIAS